MSQISTLAAIIQGEAQTPADQFGVAATIQNRVNAGFPGSENGALGVATAAGQFSAYPSAMQMPTAYATSLATALVNGNLSDFGSTGNALYYNAPGYNPAYSSGTGNNFGPGTNQYSDLYNQSPSSDFQLPLLSGAQAGQPDYGAGFTSAASPNASTAGFGVGNQNDALDHTGLTSTSPTDPSMYPATSATTSITNNDQMFNQPDPNKVETTNIASSGYLGQTQIANSTGQVAQSTLQGDTTIAQTQQQDTATAISGLGDLFARGSLVVIGLLLLGGAFVFYYMQHKDSTFGVKATSTSSGQA